MKAGCLGIVLFVLVTAPARGQEVDPRWQPWLGCWQLVEENVPQGFAARTPAKSEDTRVCVAPGGNTATVTFSTRIADQTVLEQPITADGAQHPIDEADCRGWQRADWSSTGDRLFARAEVSCKDETPRAVSGLALMAGEAWIDIQAIDAGGRESVRVRRYRRAADRTGVDAGPGFLAGSTGARRGAATFTVGDIKEAAARLSPRAVEAALVETRASFDLNAKTLIDLDNAGVPDSVIDLIVALSYPNHFVVNRRETQTASGSLTDGGFGSYSLWPYDVAAYDSFWSSPYAPYYYAPFGYAYWAGYGSPYYPYGGFVTIDPSGTGATEASGRGRLVNGAGYTQIRERQPEPIDSGATGARASGSSGSPASGDSSGSTGSSSGGSSAGVSSSGFSSGGSSSDTGRTAEPR